MPAEEYNEKLRELVEENSLMFIPAEKERSDVPDEKKRREVAYELDLRMAMKAYDEAHNILSARYEQKLRVVAENDDAK